MGETKDKLRILISYVSFYFDLGGNPDYKGDGPSMGIAKHLKDNGRAPDKIFLLWEKDYLEDKGKGDAEWLDLKKCLNVLLPSAEIERIQISFDLKTKAASKVVDVFAEFGGTVTQLFRENKGDEFYVNGSTGTHAIQTVLILLAAREPYASIVLFECDYNTNKSICWETRVSDTWQRVRDIEEREAHEEAEEAKRDDATIEKDVLAEILNLAPYARDPILLLGRTGTGKTRCASILADKLRESGRIKEEGKFVSVNCATLGTLADSQLFGHVKGAFTGAVTELPGYIKEADGGLLFLDEIGTLSPEVQGKLLKVLDDGVFRKVGAEHDEQSSFFLVCGTNENLEKAIADKKFRQDLYERIRIWSFELKPLSERLNEVSDLVDSFLNEFNKDSKRGRELGLGGRATIAKEAKAYIHENIGKLDLPGNFRTLRGIVRRLATRALMNATDCGITLEMVEREFALMPTKDSRVVDAGCLKNASGDEAREDSSRSSSREELIPTALCDLLGKDKYKGFRREKRIPLEYVAGLILNGKKSVEIEAEFLDHLEERKRPQAMKKFFNKYGKGLSVSSIRKALEMRQG